ncbi:MAG TPA: hypothetical protein VHF22_11885 [Planctomycetota bacterium]|nr:hypothetical protein [Planctomycetota bacterium]
MTAPALPPNVAQAFEVACGELGLCSASWLFVRELDATGGPEAVAALRDALGRSFPVLDFVAARWLAGARGPEIDPAGVVAACGGARRVLVVGLETAFLDALVPVLEEPRLGLLREQPFGVDWDRVLANYGGRIEPADLASFQTWGGARSALLAFVYGANGASVHVPPSWLRVTGPDVRTQFRSIVAWDVLRGPFFVYPRWLVPVARSEFSAIL